MSATTGSVPSTRVTPFRSIAAYCPPGVSAFGLGVIAEVFGAKTLPGTPTFEIALCSDRPGAVTSDIGVPITVEHGLDALVAADLVIACPWSGFRLPPTADAVSTLQTAHHRGALIAGPCVGAFLLAEAGLLDRRRATTHWRFAATFAARYPRVRVTPDVLYVDEGQVVTGAGAMAGVDMCLYLLRREHGSAIANTIARDLVAPPHRHGGQAQYLAFPAVPTTDDRLADVLAWATAHLDTALSVDTLADRAMCSRRSFYRWFKTTTGTTPHAWLRTQRLNRAEELLETTDLTVDHIAHRVGYASATALREQFTLRRGVSPHAYRRTFRGSCQEASHADGSMPHA
jgi:transcriptional regulator GlxA family with amidase domain